MSENMKIAWLTSGAGVLAAVIGSVTAHYLGLWGKEVAEQKPASTTVTQVVIDAPTPPPATLPIEDNPESKLDSIFIGMGKPYVEKLFGTPIVELKHELDSLTETNYKFEKFYLQFIFSKSGSVQFYSVVSRSESFKPCIPTINKCLGNTFAEIARSNEMDASFEHNYLYSYLTSKHYGYGEYLYLGNAGNYQNFYLGFNSLGAMYNDIHPFTLNERNRAEWDEFRNKYMPNSYGVGEIGAISDDQLYYEIGPEFYTFRNL